MKISSSQLQASTTHQFKQERTRETLEIRSSETPQNAFNVGETLERQANQAIRNQSDTKLSMNQSLQQIEKTNTLSDQFNETNNDLKVNIMKKMLEHITGKKVELVSNKDLQVDESQIDSQQTSNPENPNTTPTQADNRIVHVRDSFYESEQMNFELKGKVETSDGKLIDVNFSMSMSREFYQESEFIMSEQEAIDPLIVNYNAPAASLNSRNFHFDLNADGQKENIAFTGHGSGFLALDRNEDNQINDGSELFGTKTGNGFKELQQYDEDNNGYIDENDKIYSELQIWTVSEGKRQLLALADLGVEAISIKSYHTPFTIKDNTNQDLGYVRQTGIIIKEDGQIGSISHVDLAV